MISTDPRDNPTSPRRYAFLLLEGYSQLGFSCALEALSLSNRHPSGRQFYSWRLLSETGAPVAAYNGVTVAVDAGLVDLQKDEIPIVCAGVSVENSFQIRFNKGFLSLNKLTSLRSRRTRILLYSISNGRKNRCALSVFSGSFFQYSSIRFCYP